MYSKSERLFTQAKLSIPGGVNSPVRAFRSVGGTPIFMKKAKGSILYDVDGNEYIDYIASWGPMILGHAYPKIIDAIQEQVMHSTSFGAPTELEIMIAELIKEMVPNVDLIRMVNSGTEACMSAIRLARGFTGKDKFIKFEGCYHGHADSFLVKAGSGASTFGVPTSPGVPKSTADLTLTARYNDLESVQQLVAANKGEIAAIIIEPVAGNMGCVPPNEMFLKGLRELCTIENILLIFDEVMTGFRLAPGGAQEYLGIDADIVCYGKVIGGGLPVGAYGARREIMELISPLGPVYQAGTLSGNPVAMIAGYTILKELKDNPQIYEELDLKTQYLRDGMKDVLRKSGLPNRINYLGSMISIFFTSDPVIDFESAAKGDNEYFKKFFHAMLKRGIYLPPSAYESWFLANSISYDMLDKTIKACAESLDEMRN